MPHDPLSSVVDMIAAIETALSMTRGIAEAEFLKDERTRWAVYSQIIILGEAASRLPREFCVEHSGIPWSSIVGMRHRLVHGYDRVGWVRVWKTIEHDLPFLLV